MTPERRPAGRRVARARVEAAARAIHPVFLHSPQYVAEALGECLGRPVSLKVETQNPIRSFKGRGADWLVSQAASGVPLACASAGNFGQAMAWACRRRGIPLTVYAAEQANPLKLSRMRRLGARVVLHGEDFDAAKHEARRAALATGTRFVEDGFDIETLEGAATIALEWLAAPERPDALLIPLGNGALFNGVAGLVKSIAPEVRTIAVAAAGAPAMVESWRAGRIVRHERIATIADGIGVREPVPQALADMDGLVDDALLVGEASILEAMRLLHRHAGLVVEPSGAAGVAALLEHPEAPFGTLVGTIVCGANVTEQQMRDWL
ncbi:MAG TPA: pyridoxal-phosphate dependent enzyme [Gemmatimonadales bacterium]|nr:pyridoxal-phosphate dependent enzyme [Gemmatimonadales bacterium]